MRKDTGSLAVLSGLLYAAAVAIDADGSSEDNVVPVTAEYPAKKPAAIVKLMAKRGDLIAMDMEKPFFERDS